ncbi:hypothetical protein [Paraburkholderia diazotrophica]|uniref:Uncharacterized protein n=1 Tax=Paraburkholderia diazotrophica TaxID=667676 RepID=A0A1H6S5L6_9BURK|nr:hypothetical protein [Paraburkholderia diazotrophica]SEI61164.1 hypothetical protein SAMN05192539_10035 [Paraburkholderia diazotrophica]
MPWPIPTLISVERPKPISIRVLLPTLAAIASGAIGAVLLLWPHGKPTQTIQFWSLLIGAPLAACALAFGLTLNRWEAQQTVAEESEREQQRIVKLWRDWCRRHLRVVQSEVFLPVTDEHAPFSTANSDFPMNRERAIGFPWAKERSTAFRRTRLLHLVAVRFADALKARREIAVTLMLDDLAPEQTKAWTMRVHRIFSRTVPEAVLRIETRPATGAAQWLAEQVDRGDAEPQLVVAAQLWPEDEAEHAFSEGAAAFLVEPVATQTDSVLRPMTTLPETLEAGLAQLMQMQVAPDRLTHVWSTGCDDESVAIRSALTPDPKALAEERLLDGIVGKPGPASGWIALATALAASSEAGPQLVVWREPESEPVHLCVVAAAAPSPLPHKGTTV